MDLDFDTLLRETQSSISQKIGHAEELMASAQLDQRLADALYQAKLQHEQDEKEKAELRARCEHAESALAEERKRPLNTYNQCQIGEYVEQKYENIYGRKYIQPLSDTRVGA